MKPVLLVIPLATALSLAVCGGNGGQSAAPLEDADPTPSEACVRTSLTITSEPLSESAFQEADDALATAIELAEAGDVNGAEVAFFSGPHRTTHDIDGQLYLVDPALAVRLCNEVMILELELVGERDSSIVVGQARKLRELLAAASEALAAERQ